MTKPAALYISYDGMLEPLGQSQVIAYLERLADEVRFHLISFEKAADWSDAERRSAIAARLAAAGIVWHPLRYHKRPTVPATLFDLAQGMGLALWLATRHRVRLVHARSYIPGLIALAVKRTSRARFLFDIRGFWADERVDGGLWRADGWIYRAAKRLERALLLRADHIVTLTHSSLPVLKSFTGLSDRGEVPISVITTCADLDRFRPDGGARSDYFVLGYVGAVGTWHRFDDVLACFAELWRLRPDARLLVVNRNEHEVVRAAVARSKVPQDRVELVAADFAEMPALVARMTAGSAIRMATYSQVACAPTKIAEYLGCGIPCIANYGVGDVTEILEGARVGVVLHDFGANDRRRAVADLLALSEEPGLAERCRETALRLFALDEGVAAYRSIYRELLALGVPSRRG